MSKLLIVESRPKPKPLVNILKRLVVRASVGHVRDLPKSSKNAIDIKTDSNLTIKSFPERGHRE